MGRLSGVARRGFTPELCPTSGGHRWEITGTLSGDDITKYVPVGWDGGGDETFWG